MGGRGGSTNRSCLVFIVHFSSPTPIHPTLLQQEDLSRPLTHSELKQKIAMGMTQRREKKAAA
jgi:hypothetical protein